MIVRALDNENDWQFGKSRSNYLSDEKAIEQCVATRIRSWLNNCFFAMTDGIDWPVVLDKGRQSELDQALRATILGTLNVIGINSVDITVDSVARSCIAVYNISTIYSPNVKGLVAQGY